MWLTILLRNWQLVLIALLSVALTLSISHGRQLIAERDAKIAEIQSMQNEAQTYKTNSTQIAKEISDGIPKLLEQAKANAWANYQKKYPANAACGIRISGVLPADNGKSEAGSTERVDDVQQQEFISTCAADAGYLEKWKQWARLNDLGD